ncbi:MAG: hypothetical protein GY784_13985 [Gammaproteobacteria bacterium]|nr:hypothetical protein [Gammaproteobacteria bacterium]
MIYDKPGARDLLQEARRELMEDVLPGINPQARYKLLMINRAMELAERELESNRETKDVLERRLNHFVNNSNVELPVADLLTQHIRDGKFDSSGALYETLQLLVAFKLSATNPDKVPDNLKLRLNNCHNST